MNGRQSESEANRTSNEQIARENNASSERVAGMRETKQQQEIAQAAQKHAAFIVDRIQHGLPIYNPNTGKVVWWRGFGLPAQSVIDELAHTAAVMDYRAARSDEAQGAGMQGLIGNIGPAAQARQDGTPPQPAPAPPAGGAPNPNAVHYNDL